MSALVLGARPCLAESPAAEGVRDLKSPHQAVRVQAARRLGRLADPAAVPDLIAALAATEAPVRRAAARALGEIRDAKATDALVKALGDRDANVRFYAARALGQIRDPAAGEALVGALRDPQWPVRNQAAWALRGIKGERIASLLAEELKSEHADTAQIMWILGKSPSVVAPAPKPRELMAHWSFEGRETQLGKDITGQGNDGQVVKCTPAKGKVGQALRFGKGRYIELGKPVGLPIANREFTIMAWAKPEQPDGVVVARGGAFCGFSLYVKGGVAKFGIHRTQDGPGYIVAAKDKVVGRWVHLAGVVKTKRIELYVDGKLEASVKTPGPVPSNCGQGMEIGYDVGNSAAEIIDSFVGLIDEVKMYGLALPGEKIAEQCRPAAKE